MKRTNNTFFFYWERCDQDPEGIKTPCREPAEPQQTQLRSVFSGATMVVT